MSLGAPLWIALAALQADGAETRDASAIDDFMRLCVARDDAVVANAAAINIRRVPHAVGHARTDIAPHAQAYRASDDRYFIQFARPDGTREPLAAGCSVVVRDTEAAATYAALVERLGADKADFRLMQSRQVTRGGDGFNTPEFSSGGGLPVMVPLTDNPPAPRSNAFLMVTRDNRRAIEFFPVRLGFNELRLTQRTKYATQY